MYAAFGGLSDDVTTIKVKTHSTALHTYKVIQIGEDCNDIDLANAATLLITNIASIRDHFKKWCNDNGKRFTGDELINSNKSVAIIHDLWNIEKHAELNRPPRSGHKPKLEDLDKMVLLSTGTTPNSSSGFSVNLATDKAQTHATGSGSLKIIIFGVITDEGNTPLGVFHTICEEAINAWSVTLTAAGVPVPKME